jgi:hypothetical protein
MASEHHVEVLEVAQPKSRLNLVEHLWTDLKIAVHSRSPSNLRELEKICKE